YYDEPSDGRYFFAFGGSYSYRHPDEKEVQYSERPEVRLEEDGVGGVPPFVDTGVIAADEVHLAGVEATWVHGPFNLQAEYIASSVRAQNGEDLYFHGAYVYASFFLTGENRVWNREQGSFDDQLV